MYLGRIIVITFRSQPFVSLLGRGGCWLAGLLLFLTCGCAPGTISVPGETFDAGPVFAADQAELVHRFRVTNTTGRAVRILGERHSCSCTTLELPRVALRPGESTILTMTVSVPYSYTQREICCTVVTVHPRYPEWEYRIRFESFPRARVEPEQIRVGTLAPWKESKGTLRPVFGTWLEVFVP